MPELATLILRNCRIESDATPVIEWDDDGKKLILRGTTVITAKEGFRLTEKSCMVEFCEVVVPPERARSSVG